MEKKAVYQKWWFWLVVIVFLGAIGTISAIQEKSEPITTEAFSLPQKTKNETIALTKVNETKVTDDAQKIEEIETETTGTTNKPTEQLIKVVPKIDINQIAGRTVEEVAKILGEPLHTEILDLIMGPKYEKRRVTKHFYKELIEQHKMNLGRVEIIFVKGRAEVIQVNLFGEEFIKDDLLVNAEYVGLTREGLEENDSGIRLDAYGTNVQGYYSIAVLEWCCQDEPEDGLVKVITEEQFK
ncbi:hypothetical protein ACFSO7_01425 [Bacillus sp. CGMCC 1.16607]|uniref:hypothetical protein n=1 Tax=Bacillus sp. CGMCC 1.16607 TaxID=3351842 RepID=UPI00363D3849